MTVWHWIIGFAEFAAAWWVTERVTHGKWPKNPLAGIGTWFDWGDPISSEVEMIFEDQFDRTMIWNGRHQMMIRQNFEAKSTLDKIIEMTGQQVVTTESVPPLMVGRSLH
jgi:hypothetical protein